MFASELTKQTRLPHDQLLAVQLVSGFSEPTIEEIQRQRLLTVPRVRKKNPPTHLIVARNGDVMRGRLLQMNDQILKVESRLETIEIQRDIVNQILWLDTAASVEGDAASDSATGSLTMQAMMRGDNRMSLTPHRVKNGMLEGENLLLGHVQISLTQVDELLIGSVVKSELEKLPYGNWKLSDAPEPILLDDAGNGITPGAISPLVGTDAPDFALDTLSGDRFTLSDHMGKVVVLDFWATWCGPCLQAMPMIEETVSAFDGEEVLLIAVNLQETPIRFEKHSAG